MNMSSPGGWKQRLKQSREKQAARDEAAEIRAARAAFYEAQRVEAERQAAVNAEVDKATRCSCPVCDAGYVSVALAERVLRALERLASDSKPDPAVLEYLAAVSRGQVPPGTARPPRMILDVKHARAVPQLKEARKRSHSKGLETPAGLTEDGALIELDD